jgi:hypothetical protein
LGKLKNLYKKGQEGNDIRFEINDSYRLRTSGQLIHCLEEKCMVSKCLMLRDKASRRALMIGSEGGRYQILQQALANPISQRIYNPPVA